MTEQNENFDLTELNRDSQSIDELFARFPAPEPGSALVDDIKRRIYSQRRRIGVRQLIIKTACISAVVLLAWFFIFDDMNAKKPLAAGGETSGSIFEMADQSISAIEKDIDLLQSEYLSVCLNEDSSSSLLGDSIMILESELIETDYSFWKG